MRKDLKRTYESCKRNGMLEEIKSIEAARVNALHFIAQEDLQSAKLLLKEGMVNSSYKLHYDSIHGLAEAIMHCHRPKSANHQCMFAYLCQLKQFSHLWEFFEDIRAKRNNLCYYGESIAPLDWGKMATKAHHVIASLQSFILELLENNSVTLK